MGNFIVQEKKKKKYLIGNRLCYLKLLNDQYRCSTEPERLKFQNLNWNRNRFGVIFKNRTGTGAEEDLGKVPRCVHFVGKTGSCRARTRTTARAADAERYCYFVLSGRRLQ